MSLLGTEIMWCDRCDLGITEPPPQVDYETFSYGERDEDLWLEFSRPLVRIANSASTAKTWMDFGAGSGTLVRAAMAAGFSAVGVEVDEPARERSEALGTLIYPSLESLPDDNYGVISISHVLEHLKDPVGMLRVLAQHLEVGGIIIAVQPDCTGLIPRLMPRHWSGWVPDQHFWHFTSKSLSALMGEAGLVPERHWRTSLHYGGRGWKCRLISTAAHVASVVGSGDALTLVARKPAPLGLPGSL